jgi:predicted O-linked N-acetylglucosamine transferase (SPINDLY family)
LICPGTPFKYAPQHDRILPEIARRLTRCRFIFFTHRLAALSRKLSRRLEAEFARSGLDFEGFVSFVPWQDKAGFYGLMERADVFLDTIGFSGFNTALQAVECGLPIVTREGRFMRGRLASGILKRMGLTDLVASSEQDYVALAVRLAQDAEYRGHVRNRIAESSHALFGDLAPIRALETFLIKAAGPN